MADGDYLGLDLGEKRTGIARVSTQAKIPQPLKVVETEKLNQELQQLITREKTVGIVVGLPRGLDGNETAQTEWVRGYVAQLKNSFDLPFHFQDEALTTTEAIARQPNNSHHDAEAAAIILQDFING